VNASVLSCMGNMFINGSPGFNVNVGVLSYMGMCS